MSDEHGPGEAARSGPTMRRVGLLGGMSWQSTAAYYRVLNESIGARSGGHASAPLTIHSVDFGELEPLQRTGDWATQGQILAAAAAGLERSGVDAVALATNTLHLIADQITADLSVPFIDLIDVVAAGVAQYSTVGLLATEYTMSSDLYPKRLATRGTEVIVPDGRDRALVHDIIYRELVHGVVTAESRAVYRAAMAGLVDRGAEAIVLGCTEIGLLVGVADAAVPVLDTTDLHCRVITDYILTGVLA